MIKDIYAEFGTQTGNNLDRIQRDKGIDAFTKLRLLSVFLGTTVQEIAKVHHRVLIHRRADQPSPFSKDVICPALEMIKELRLLPPSCTLSNNLPFGSFMLQFSFILAKPYLSQDDEGFYVCENPIRKEKVFKVPMVAGSSWKGNLRWTAMKIFTDKLPDRINELTLNEYFGPRSQMVRLFGHEKDAMENYLDTVLAEALCNDEEKKNPECVKEKKKFVEGEFEEFLRNKGYIGSNVEGRQGRLNFYPTFFDQIGLEVINPHDRKTKAGTVPIYIESVPEGATGTFTLLYVPFDLIGKPEDMVRKEVAQDIETICEAVKEMMTTYGFSAKKTSGFGVIKDSIQGYFLTNAGFPVIEIESEQTKKISAPVFSLSRYLTPEGKLQPEFLNPDGTFKEVEPKVYESWNRKKRQVYDKAKKFHEKQLAQDKEDEAKEEKKIPAIQSKQYPLKQVADIELIARKLAEALEGGK